MQADTIAAIATPAGRGGIGVVRIAGPRAADVSRALTGIVPAARRATLAEFRDAGGAPIDRGLMLFFPAPHSYTGEPMLELHGHGGPMVQNLLLRRSLELGCRLAEPGELNSSAIAKGRCVNTMSSTSIGGAQLKHSVDEAGQSRLVYTEIRLMRAARRRVGLVDPAAARWAEYIHVHARGKCAIIDLGTR